MPEFTALAIADSYMQGNPEGAQDNNHGGFNAVGHGVEYAGDDKTSLKRPIANFDVSRLAGRTINSAKLRRYVIVRSISGTMTTRVSRCTRPADWVEDEVTWDEYASGSAWTAEGGDFDDTGPPAAVDQDEPDASLWTDFTGLKAFVTDAIDNRNGIVSLILRLTDETPEVTQKLDWHAMNRGSRIWRLIVDHDGDPVDNTRRIERRTLRGAGRGVLRGM